MKLPKIDFKKIALSTAGEAGGLFALNELGKIEFVKKQKPGMKGVIYKALGEIVVPMLAGKAKKGGELINGVANTLNVAGTSQLMAAFMPGKVATIGGYEDYALAGPGYEMEESVDGAGDDYDMGDPNDYEESLQ